MGKLFRENPIQIAFPEAVNLFSARSKFVHEASQKSTVRYWYAFLSSRSCIYIDVRKSLKKSFLSKETYGYGICLHWNI